MRTISIANFKGGTGKTVTAVNLAAELADAGRRVLLIDADPQHNATDFYCRDDAAATLTDVLEGSAEAVWPDVITPAGREGLDLLPADMGLLRLDLAAIANGSSAAQHRLGDFLDALREDDAYDFVLIDCPPSFTAASVAGLVQSGEAVLPTRVDAFSRAGVGELIAQLRQLGRVSARIVFTALITMTDRTNLCRQGAAALRASGIPVFDTEIRDCVKVGESTYAREPLRDYAPRSTAARDYAALARELLAGEEKDPSTPLRSAQDDRGEA